MRRSEGRIRPSSGRQIADETAGGLLTATTSGQELADDLVEMIGTKCQEGLIASPTPTPTLSHWGLICTAGLLLLAGAVVFCRQSRALL